MTMTRTTFRERAYTGPADLPAVVGLLNLCDIVDQLEEHYTVENFGTELTDPTVDPAHDLRLWEDAAGRLVGFGQLWLLGGTHGLDGRLYWYIHPDVRGSGIEDAVCAWAATRTAAAGQARGGGTHLSSPAGEHNAYHRATLEAHGFTVVRYFFQLARALAGPLPTPELPPGYTLRPLTGEAELAAWMEMHRETFVDHWNYHPLPLERRQHWMADPHYRAAGDLVIVAPDGTLAAFCLCGIDPEANAQSGRNEGWIQLLGVRRGFRKRGLGRAALLAGLRYLQGAGAETALLDVDAANPTGALRLYEGAGFTRRRTDLRYNKSL